MLEQLWKGFCDFVYPRVCLLCQQGLPSLDKKIPLCSFCLHTLEINIPPFCQRCCSHLHTPNEDSLCVRCQRQKFNFDRVWAVSRYNDSLRRLIHLFKYKHKTILRYQLAHLVTDFFNTYQFPFPFYDFITPMPLHPARLRERGYNQSELLAELISQRLAIPLSTNLKRIRHTPFQANCTQKERWTNIFGAFKIKYPSYSLKKSFLLVDDLMTTGATASEAARILKEDGARRVDVLTLAVVD